MKTGISLYPGLEGTAQEQLTLIEQAADLGISRVFTSFHIPETDRQDLRRTVGQILSKARSCGMDVVADISPQTADLLGLAAVRPQELLRLGITTARLDYGFSAEKAALFSNVMAIQLNASTLRRPYLEELRAAGADFSHIDCLHNFYPRPHSGLGETYLSEQSARLRSYGLSAGAFVASSHGRRGPLYEGLPTLEKHRGCSVSLSARHLAAMGLQSVFIGDPFPSEQELRDLACAGREKQGTVVIKARLLDGSPKIRDFLSQPFTSRLDPARDLIRTQESRASFSGLCLKAGGPRRPLKRGDVTIDNEEFLRYMGEVSLVLTDLPPERRTTIVAEILPEEEFLLSYIEPGRLFRLSFVR